MHKRAGIIVVVFAFLTVPGMAFAAGFSVFEAGAKALGMGGAFVAQADDPSAIFFNPAGIAGLEGVQTYLGMSLIFTGTDFSGVNPDPGFGVTEETGTLIFPPINVYVTWQVAEAVVLGLGLFNPFGLGQKWKNEAEYSGRHIAWDTELRTFDINPTVAWQAHEQFSIGAGLQLIYADVDIKRYLQEWDPNGSGFLDVGQVNLTGSGWNVGWNLGALYEHEKFSIGATFRSKVTSKIDDGEADFEQQPSGNDSLDVFVTTVFPADQRVATEIKLPWTASVGAMYSGVERWRFEVDVIFFGWSEFDVLPFNFEDESLNIVREQNYEDKAQIRTGIAYELSETTELRAGYYYDPTPQPRETMSPLLGDATRHGITAGVGYGVGAWYLDGFALALIASDRSSDGLSLDNYNGSYQAFGFIFGLNFGYRF